VILVNRGWVPSAKKDPLTRLEGQISGETTVQGICRSGYKSKPSMFTPDNKPSENTWYWLDLPAMAKHTGASPVLVEADIDKSNPTRLPIGGQTVVALRNDHLNYALTWFTLTACLSVMAFRLMRKPVWPRTRISR